LGVVKRVPVGPSSLRLTTQSSTFPEAPLSSRTVGFPEYGWQQRHFAVEPSHTERNLSTCLHTPQNCMVISTVRHRIAFCPVIPALCPAVLISCVRHLPRAPLPVKGVTSARAVSTLLRSALPDPHRSYWLMRRTKTLPPLLVYPCKGGSLQVVASPCWEVALPGVISAILVSCIGARTLTPSGLFDAFTRFFSKSSGLTSLSTG
jgi:hypothetical protein